jgi:hypothetical protein
MKRVRADVVGYIKYSFEYFECKMLPYRTAIGCIKDPVTQFFVAFITGVKRAILLDRGRTFLSYLCYPIYTDII